MKTVLKKITALAAAGLWLSLFSGLVGNAAYNSPVSCPAMPAFTGDVTTTAGSCATALPNVNANVGTFQGLTVNAKGQVTGAVNQNYTGLGANTFTGIQTFSSGTNQQVRVVTASGNVTVATTDYFICVNKATGAATIANLPSAPTTGATFIVKDCKGDAATNNITVTPAAGTIDGSATFVMSQNYQAANFTYNGTAWNVW